MAAPRASIAVRFTRASLTLAAAIGLTRVFAGRSWLFTMVVAALVPPALLLFAERRRWHALVRIALVGVAGVWLAALVADPETVFAGIPSFATIGSLGHALARAPHVMQTAVVPVTPAGSALVLAFVGVFVAAALTEWIATSLDAPIGAFAPGIALFVVVAAVGSGSWVPGTALYALAALAYLLALAEHDLVTRRTWFHAAQPRRSRILAGGALVGALAMTGALIVGPSVPGARGGAWVNYRQLGRGGEGNILSAPPPILSIRDKLTLGPVQELFTVNARRAAYWRVIALDWFTDDNAWGINKATEQSASHLTFPPDLPPSTTLEQHFHIAQLDPHWLPAAYRPVSINLNAAEVVPDSLTLLLDSKTGIDTLNYDVQSEVPTPSQALLTNAPFSDPRVMARDLELPSDFPASVRTLAERITARAHGPYGRAVALERFFRVTGHFVYTTHTKIGDSPDAIVEFLQTRQGFCEQFAAAFAAMARSVGVPTRVAVGYQPGTYQADGLFHVTNRDAHAWPEVWIEGTGWIPFEPTPAFKEPTLGIGTGGPAPAGGHTRVTTTTGANTTTSSPRQTPTSRPRGLGGAVSVQQPAAKRSSHRTFGRVVGALAIALAAVLLGALLFLGALSLRVWERTRHRRHDRDPRGRVLGAWSEALDVLATAGVPPRPSATALEFALRHAPAHGAGDAGPPLMELARLQSAALYAPEPPTANEARAAWQQVDAIRAAVRRAVAGSTRWRRRLRLRPRGN